MSWLPARSFMVARSTSADAMTNVHAEEMAFREIRAIYDENIVRVYQAYNEAIATSAVAANSFRAPLEAGLWSATRMTWIKPSAVWMAYRCGWTTMKDKNQARVLALDVSRQGFENLLMNARLSHDGADAKCKNGSVTVQWDPERQMHPAAPGRQVFTFPMPAVRSIQIGLRGAAVETLLDPEFLLKITDVTSAFAKAGEALAAGNVEIAAAALWPKQQERLMPVPAELRAVLAMDVEREGAQGAAARNEGRRSVHKSQGEVAAKCTKSDANTEAADSQQETCQVDLVGTQAPEIVQEDSSAL